MKFDISGWLESSEFCWKTESISTVLIETIGDVIGAMKRQSEVSLLVATAVQRVTEWNCCYIIVFRCCCCCIIVRWCWCIIACWCCYCITIITCVSIVFSCCKTYLLFFTFYDRVQQIAYLKKKQNQNNIYLQSMGFNVVTFMTQKHDMFMCLKYIMYT